jgi:uncharacterized delta-60 repeat protein
MRRAAITVAVATSFALAVLVPALAQGAEGDLDPSFGSGGRVTTPIGSDDEAAEGAAIDSQGRIVTAGYTYGTDYNFALARYTSAGNLDPSFGTAGKVVTPIGSSNDVATAVAIDSQGRIVVAGYSGFGSSEDFAVARYTPGGVLDTSFGPAHTGIVTTDFFHFADEANSVAIDSQGRIVVAGFDLQGDNDFAVARYTDNGTLDTTFGPPTHPGKVTVDFTPGANDDDLAKAVAIDSQGRIVLAGRSNSGGTDDFALARLNGDGSRDATFGSNPAPEQGEVTTPFGSQSDTANAVAIDSQDRIVVAGQAFLGGTAGADFALARYTPGGVLDTSFNGTGKVTTPIGSGDDFARAVAIDPQGRLVVGGDSVTGVNDDNFALARYTSAGTPDPSFGTAGKVTTTFGSSTDSVNAVAVDPHERIVAAGYYTNSSDKDFALARYIGDAVPPTPSIGSGPGEGSYTNDPTPTFQVSSSEAGSSFACGFDGLSGACTSPFTPSAALGDGPHAFTLTATDRAGNTSAATIRHFTVDTHKPELKIKGKGKVKTRGRKARDKLKLKANEPATFKCKVDRKKAKKCKAKFKTPKLKLGKHKVKVTATDRAGNRVSKTKKLKVVRKP